MPLGVLPNDETSTEGMVAILEQMHEYVPDIQAETKTVPFPLAFGGDMLTAARARTAREIRVTTPGKKALRGLIPFSADWHAKVNFMKVRLYKCAGSSANIKYSNLGYCFKPSVLMSPFFPCSSCGTACSKVDQV